MLTVNSVTITTTNTQQHRDTTNPVQQLMLMLIVPSPSQQLSQQQHQNTENLVQQLTLMLVVSSVTATTAITTTTLEYNKPSTTTNVNSPTTITTATTSKYRNPVQQLILMLVISSITFTTAITATTLRYNKPRTIIKVNS